VECEDHGISQVSAPWAGPRSKLTLLFERKIIDALKECDTSGVARLTGLSWDVVFTVMKRAVKRGMERRQRRIPKYLGVDEKSFAKRHKYETIVCDLERGTVEYVGRRRKQATLEKYYKQFSPEELGDIAAIAMDMWDAYIAATREYVPSSEEKIVFDRYHVTRFVTHAVDLVRRGENKRIAKLGDDRLKGTRHLWLFNEENIPEWKAEEFAHLKASKLRTARAWAIKESLRQFWTYVYPKNAEKHFKRWYF
jgi:transposase